MFNVTIDGLAGCGKSTMSRLIAKALNFRCLNTGSIYRAITCHYLSKHTKDDITDENITSFVKDLDVKVDFSSGVQVVTVCGKEYTKHLRDEEISNLTPIISGYLVVREKVRDIQRDFAKNNDCVVEGRDIGSVVLKDADCKLFFVATSKVRAQRRYEQIKDSENCPSFQEILNDIEERDRQDRTREHGAMIPADDAIIVDNTNDSIEETLQKCLQIINDKRNIAR